LLFCAIRDLDVDMVASLIGAGADVKAKNRAGQSALEYALQRGWKKVVRRMIDAHEDKDWIDEYGQECEDNTQRILNMTALILLKKTTGLSR